MSDNVRAYSNNKLVTSYALSDREYRQLCDIVYAHAGIFLGDNKKELMHARLSKILRKRGIGGFKEYMIMLEKDPAGDELVTLLDAISTNVTHFFREEKHFGFLVDSIARDKKRDGLRIWSAGCSSGEEPYSIAITLKGKVLNGSGSAPYILGTDISTTVLKKAMTGVYSDKTINNLDRQTLRTYFLKGKGQSEGMIRVKKDITSLVTFKRLNLMDDFGFDQGFDYIFCRNVMIYFDNQTRQKLVSRFSRALKPGGYFIIGHSESLNGVPHNFGYVKPTIYRKV